MGEIIAFRDKSGKEWGLSSYVETLANQATIQAYRQGGVNEILEEGGAFGRISEGESNKTCEICKKWAGKIVSLSAHTKGAIPSIDDAVSEGLFHINCIHTVNIVSIEEAIKETLNQ